MRHVKARVLIMGAGSLLAVGTIAVVSLHGDQAITCKPNGSSQTICRIDEPNVKQLSTDYRQVAFHAGDTVTVSAGGCVQTGGSGATWKRYVNPSGSNSNRMYWGTISIPGATQGVVRVSDVVGRKLTVPSGIADANLFLRLGYIDDGYGDNGYYSHDDGTENQCKGSVNAFVVLTINHPAGTTTTSTCGGTTGNSPLDLVWTDCDPNGFPKNPRWRYQVDHNGQVPPPPSVLCASGFGASCTSWPLTNDSGFWCGPHRNWFAVTYESPIDWEAKSTAGTDDDYNYRLFPLHNEGILTHQNLTTNGLEVEFDSDETIDHFTSPLWTKFHSLVDSNNTAAQAQVKSKTAVVTGLLGLDCGHPDCSSELHPAYAMAVNMDDSNLTDDTWGVFARNWGDEGFCGSDQHNLPLNDLKLQIPWLPGASSVIVLPATQFYVFANSGSNASVSSPQITYATGQGVLIDFSLPDPTAQLGVEGEVHLQWTLPAGVRRTTVVSRSPATATTAGTVGKPETEKPEARMAALLSQMTAPQTQAFRTRLQATAVSRTALSRPKLPLRPATAVAALPRPPRLAKQLAGQSARDPRMVQKSESLRVSLCEAYKDAVPGHPSACLATNPRAQ